MVEAGGVRGAQSGCVGVVRVTDDRHVRIGVGDLVGIDPGDVRDHHVRQIRVVDGDQVMPGEQGLELPPEVEVDPTEQDRRHG